MSREDSDKAVLKKVERYLGKTLKEYAKTNPINTSQRIGVAKWINKNIPDCQFTLEQLKRKGIQELRKLRAEFEEKELYQIKLKVKRSLVVYLDECERLSVQLPDSRHKNDLAFMALALRTACAWLASVDKQEGFNSVLDIPPAVRWAPLSLNEGMDASKLRDFVCFQAFEALQGSVVNRKLIVGTLQKYLTVDSLQPDWSFVTDTFACFEKRYSAFRLQASSIRGSILQLGIADSLLVHEYLESVKLADAELEWFESREWAKGASEHDYSGMLYEVEEDNVPIPPPHGLARGSSYGLS